MLVIGKATSIGGMDLAFEEINNVREGMEKMDGKQVRARGTCEF